MATNDGTLGCGPWSPKHTGQQQRPPKGDDPTTLRDAWRNPSLASDLHARPTGRQHTYCQRQRASTVQHPRGTKWTSVANPNRQRGRAWRHPIYRPKTNQPAHASAQPQWRHTPFRRTNRHAKANSGTNLARIYSLRAASRGSPSTSKCPGRRGKPRPTHARRTQRRASLNRRVTQQQPSPV